MGALSDPIVGEYFAENYVAYYVRIGSFTVLPAQLAGELPGDDAARKVGGNVASFFCSPQGRVVHGVTGPVSQGKLLTEASWAVNTYEPIRRSPRVWPLMSREHRQAAEETGNRGMHALQGNTYEIHYYLGQNASVRVEDFSREVFQQLLFEPVDGDATPLLFADRQIQEYERLGLPYVVAVYNAHDPSGNWLATVVTSQFAGGRQIWQELPETLYLVAIEAQEFEAARERHNWAEQELPGMGRVRFLFFNEDGRFVESVLGDTSMDSLEREVNRVLHPRDGERELANR